MNRYLKKIIIGFSAVIVLTVSAGAVVSYFFEDEVVRFVIESINENVNSRIRVQSARFSLFRKFPGAAVEFRHVEMSPARDFDTLSFDAQYGRRLLSAESVFAELNLFRLLRKDFRITKIEVCNGNINMLTDKNGRHNFIFWKTTETTDGKSTPIELQNVTLRNVGVYYGHKRSNTVISLHAEKAHLNGRFASRQYSLGADWEGAVRLFSVDGDVYIRDKALELSGKLDADGDKFTIRKSEITLAQMKMNVSGGFATGDAVDLDLHFEGDRLDYASCVSLLPEQYGRLLSDYPGKGIFDFSANIKGLAGNGKRPRVEAKFGMEKGLIARRNTKIKLSDLSFSGTFTSGEQNKRATSVLNVRNFGCNIGGGVVKGSLLLRDFSNPKAVLKINGSADLEQLHQFIRLKDIAFAKGRVNADLTAEARLKRLSLEKAEDIDRLDVTGSLKLGDASIVLSNRKYRIAAINGDIRFDKQITSKNLSFVVNGNDFKVDGSMERLIPYMLRRNKTMFLNAKVASRNLCVDSLLASGAANAKPAAGKPSESAPLLLPENIIFDIDLTASAFRYQKLEAEDLRTHITYQPRVMSVRSINFSAMSGKVIGSGTVANDAANNIFVLGETMLDRIDIRRLFQSFDNFSQNVVRAEHLKGRLSGDIGFAVGWDNKMRLRKDEIKVESKLELAGGELTGFEPMENLSRFVALEELQNIRFSTLRTQISIRNGEITLPETNIESSTVNISGSGTHLFDNSYTYRVKVLLSELLAAKARKAKRENHENEYAEDGGKRAAIYLKVTGKGDDFKIAYDRQSARASVATDIKREKQSLKNMLNEEFGWFKKDSLPQPAASSNTGKLRFTFEDEPQKETATDKGNKRSGREKQNKDEEKIKVEWE